MNIYWIIYIAGIIACIILAWACSTLRIGYKQKLSLHDWGAVVLCSTGSWLMFVVIAAVLWYDKYKQYQYDGPTREEERRDSEEESIDSDPQKP